ncbi:S8 family serine peptidase [Chitinophaga oryziterrae]|uniref:S8 family serine peptidase n=1 Tax=Chitinophaga oryziterrae TaxID=1031224 RepID=A0A6N8JHA4_9BACT|nr:S8 family peptidase [Chitinophaga oryziterrae]MVT44590.1 S8 family serine peptidase [Chitinophaga oryziterrae]
MADKPHLYYRKDAENIKDFKPPARGAGKRQSEEKNYTPKKEEFINSRDVFLREREERIQSRSPQLNIPAHVDHIQICFHDTFDSSTFENKYRINFGLSASAYYNFNTVGLFAIIDSDLFNNFIQEINKFIDTSNHYSNVTYNQDVKFIKEFSLLTSNRIIKYTQFKPHIIIDLTDNVEIFNDYIHPIELSLLEYLRERGITFYDNLEYNKIELLGVDEGILREIANNFDIIQSINSYAAGLVRPTPLNLPEKSFGFDITNADSELPVIGIIDTGISNQTPLAPLIINQGNEFDITNTSPVTDGVSHGTAVAALAALGNRLFPSHIGNFEADAKLLSLKVLDNGGGYIPEAEVVSMIREANTKYGVKIFTLTIGYTDPKKYNDTISEYAYTLDSLTYELDILIFISIGNNSDLQRYDGRRFVNITYPLHFDSEASNLFIPAESMNNVTVGAAAGNFENNGQICISPDGIFPAIYTRTFHINKNHPSLNWTRINKRLYKPDLCHYAGDYDDKLSPEHAGLKVLSSQPGIFYDKEVGTSYAVPLAANIAAKLLKKYPSLSDNMQTVKALLLNGAFCETIEDGFSDLQNITLKGIYGNGIPDSDVILQSDENRVTFILEDVISPKKIKSYILKLPEYLLNVNRQNGVLHIDATLSFKFKPVPHNQLAYCPVHISFGIFRNIALEEFEQNEDGSPKLDEDNKPIPIGINGNTTENYVFAESWAQDYYYKAKMLSNSQKVSFNISKKILQEENRTLKIAVNAALHKLLSPAIRNDYNVEYPFTLVFSIRENPAKGVNSNRLYDELYALNDAELLNLADANLDAEQNQE